MLLILSLLLNMQLLIFIHYTIDFPRLIIINQEYNSSELLDENTLLELIVRSAHLYVCVLKHMRQNHLQSKILSQ